MSAWAQEYLAAGAILLGVYILLVQIPVFGTLLKLSLRLAWVFAPIVIIAGALAYLWYEGRALFFGEPVIAPVVTDAGSGAVPGAAPDRPVPLPPRRPGS